MKEVALLYVNRGNVSQKKAALMERELPFSIED